MSPRRVKSKAFTLTELLTVLAIIGIISALSFPALSSALEGDNASNSTLKLVTLLQQARQHASANNTYVYVSLHSQSNSHGQPELCVALTSPNDGADISGKGTSSFTLGNGDRDARLLNKVTVLEGMITKELSEVSGEVVPRPDSAKSNDLASSAGTATVNIGGTDYPVTFWFAPDGSASSDSTIATRLELAIVPEKRNDAQWASCIQIAGPTGSVRVYRAN